jgi:prepilin-type processing-associated H-X9-DG protein
MWDAADVAQSPLGTSLIASQTEPGFSCPSDELFGNAARQETSHYLRTGRLMGLTNYKGVQGAKFCWGDWANPGAGQSCEPWENGDGAIYPMNWIQSQGWNRFRDGLSSTLLIGEDVYDAEAPGSGRFGLGSAWAHSVEACAIAAMPINARRPDGTAYPTGDWTGQNGFHSQHVGGAHFAFADGSVIFLSENIALGLYHALATVGGKEVVNEF